mgnify:CR=1 FL=1
MCLKVPRVPRGAEGKGVMWLFRLVLGGRSKVYVGTQRVPECREVQRETGQRSFCGRLRGVAVRLD